MVFASRKKVERTLRGSLHWLGPESSSGSLDIRSATTNASA
jgi:hypothetical protein